MAAPATKPYVKLAYTLVLLGMGLFAIERYGLTELAGPGHPLQLDGNVAGILVLAPVALVAAGCVTFLVGKMRRL